MSDTDDTPAGPRRQPVLCTWFAPNLPIEHDTRTKMLTSVILLYRRALQRGERRRAAWLRECIERHGGKWAPHGT